MNVKNHTLIISNTENNKCVINIIDTYYECVEVYDLKVLSFIYKYKKCDK